MNSRSPPIQSDSGFTLVELMVTIAIMAILLAVAAPSFREIIQSQRIRAASSDLYASLALARSEAIKRNVNISLTPIGGDWANGWQVPNGAAFIEQHSPVQGVSISGPASVRFLSSGRVDAGADSTFTVSGTGTSNKRCVGISLSGRPMVKSC